MVGFADVAAAARRMRGLLHRTPLLESLALNNMVGGRVLVKAECLQRTGTFKVRGATNRILTLAPDAKRRGVVAFSSGNFGQGLAAAAARLGVPATIVMPEDSPRNKVDRARSYGAEVALSPVVPAENREVTAARMAEELSAERGLELLHPFEDREVIAGQGTVGLELAEQCGEVGAALDAFVVQTGGGGLTAGCCLALAELMPGVPRYAVEPEAYDDHAQSLSRGERVTLQGNPPSICDALQAAAPGMHTFPITSRLLAGVKTVSDAEVRHAMRVAYETLQVALEPSGAVALAAVLFGHVDAVGRTVGVVASGGNLDVVKLARVLGCPAHGGDPSQPSVPPPFDWTGLTLQRIELARPFLAVSARASGATLGCGYLNLEAAERNGEPAATVTGAATYAAMLDAEVQAANAAARNLGVAVGMPGRAALELFKGA